MFTIGSTERNRAAGLCPWRFAGKFATSALLTVLIAVTSAIAATDRTKPTTPANLRITATTPTSVSLAWNPSTDNSGSFTYTVRETNSGQTRAVPQTQTTYTWTGLQPNTFYLFLVYARDGAGNQSANSNTVYTTTPVAPTLPVPANLHATAVGPNSIAVAWNPASGAGNYQVSVDANINGTLQTSYTANWLAPGTAHTFMVRSMNGAAISAWSAPLVVNTIIDTTPPSAPVVTGTALSPGVVLLSWSAATDDSLYIGYNVYVNGQPAHGMLPDNTVPRTVTLYNLHAATTYEFTVKAYDAAGNFSAASPALVLTTPAGTDTIAPAAPTNLRRQGRDNGISSLSLWWDGYVPDNVGVMAFEVYMDNVLVGESLYDPEYEMLLPFFTVYHLPPGTTHVFTVKARDEAGNVSPASAPLTFTTQPSSDTVPPGAPTGLWGDTAPGCDFINLQWTTPTDNVDTPGQLDYEIYEDGVFRGMWNDEAFQGAFGRHRYFIKAVDRAGNRSAPSNEIVLDSGLGC